MGNLFSIEGSTTIFWCPCTGFWLVEYPNLAVKFRKWVLRPTQGVKGFFIKGYEFSDKATDIEVPFFNLISFDPQGLLLISILPFHEAGVCETLHHLG
jgi:hypothetical protein